MVEELILKTQVKRYLRCRGYVAAYLGWGETSLCELFGTTFRALFAMSIPTSCCPITTACDPQHCVSLAPGNPEEAAVSYTTTLWPMLRTVISADRGGNYPKRVSYPVIDLALEGIVQGSSRRSWLASRFFYIMLHSTIAQTRLPLETPIGKYPI